MTQLSCGFSRSIRAIAASVNSAGVTSPLATSSACAAASSQVSSLLLILRLAPCDDFPMILILRCPDDRPVLTYWRAVVKNSFRHRSRGDIRARALQEHAPGRQKSTTIASTRYTSWYASSQACDAAV